MAKGTVKDPTGHQSGPYDFGYIQRTDGFSFDEQNRPISVLWPKDITAKVIPFLNKPTKPGDDNSRPYAQGQPFDFDVVEAEVHYAGECLGTIGIAVKQKPLETSKAI